LLFERSRIGRAQARNLLSNRLLWWSGVCGSGGTFDDPFRQGHAKLPPERKHADGDGSSHPPATAGAQARPQRCTTREGVTFERARVHDTQIVEATRAA
jgi:hypothetical protein